MTKKNNLPPSSGFAKQSDPDEFESKCLTCGLIIAERVPRALIFDEGVLKGVECVRCFEADGEALKFGTPKNPL